MPDDGAAHRRRGVRRQSAHVVDEERLRSVAPPASAESALAESERTSRVHDDQMSAGPPGRPPPAQPPRPPGAGQPADDPEGRGASSLRCTLATAAGRSAAALSRRLGLGEGAVIGGRVAYALDPGALTRLAAGRRVVLVTGTNGKTTTAHLLAAALRSRVRVVHNESGANMADGALAALLADREAPVAVLEVDELNLAEVSAATRPELVVLLNLTRDQLDRSTEVGRVAGCIRSALQSLPRVHVLANGDDPVVTAAVGGLPDLQWFAGGCAWTQDSTLCPRCVRPLARNGADWYCGTCSLRRPVLDWQLRGPVVHVRDGRSTALTMRLPGGHNARNALAAVAAAAALGIEPDVAAAAVAQVRSVAHRYATVDHGRHRLTLLLAKNPAGWRATLPLSAEFAALVLVINAREADGRDTSWLWDVPFECLPAVPVAACGQRAADLGLRLAYAGVPHTTQPDPLAALGGLPSGDVGVVANYTAFSELWHRLDRAR